MTPIYENPKIKNNYSDKNNYSLTFGNIYRSFCY